MDNAYIGVVELFAGNFAPYGWRLCNGDLISIADNEALYSIIGTLYGGDGVTNFALPNLNEAVPVGANPSGGFVPSGVSVAIGQTGGVELVSLVSSNLPSHNHVTQASSNNADQNVATSTSYFAATGDNSTGTFSPTFGYLAVNADMSLFPSSVTNTGGNLPHNNVMPSLGMQYIICVEGLYPSFN